MKNAIILIVFLLSLMLNAEKTENKENIVNSKKSAVGFFKKSDDLIIFSVNLSNGVVVKNISLKHLSLTNEWKFFLYKEWSDLQIMRSNGENIQKIRLKEYSEMIELLINKIAIDFPDIKIDGLGMDLEMVDETWDLVVKAVKKEAEKLPGTCFYKDRKITDVMKKALAGSTQVEITCKIFKKYSFKCSKSSIEMVAFKDEFIGEPWSKIIDDPDAGLKYGQSLWIGK